MLTVGSGSRLRAFVVPKMGLVLCCGGLEGTCSPPLHLIKLPPAAQSSAWWRPHLRQAQSRKSPIAQICTYLFIDCCQIDSSCNPIQLKWPWPLLSVSFVFLV